MEKEGLIRAIQNIKEQGLTIDTLVTDRHLQISKHMRENEPDIKHRSDGWHVGKGKYNVAIYQTRIFFGIMHNWQIITFIHNIIIY